MAKKYASVRGSSLIRLRIGIIGGGIASPGSLSHGDNYNKRKNKTFIIGHCKRKYLTQFHGNEYIFV